MIFPADWMQGVLVKDVPKKGGLIVCDDWRVIMLLCIVLKVFCKVIFNRMQERIDATLRRQQAGFRAGHSCEDHIVTRRIILEKTNEFQESLYLVITKKLLTVSITKPVWSLKAQGVPEKIIGLVEAQYRAFSSGPIPS